MIELLAVSDAFWSNLFTFLTLVVTSVIVPWIALQQAKLKAAQKDIQATQDQIKTQQTVADIKADARDETLVVLKDKIHEVHELTNGMNKQLTQAVEDRGIANTAEAVSEGKMNTAAAVSQGVSDAKDAFTAGVKSETDKGKSGNFDNSGSK